MKSKPTAAVLGLTLALCGCASTPPRPACPPPVPAPSVLMQPLPAPGSFRDRLEAIIRQGQTSAPTSGSSPTTRTP